MTNLRLRLHSWIFILVVITAITPALLIASAYDGHSTVAARTATSPADFMDEAKKIVDARKSKTTLSTGKSASDEIFAMARTTNVWQGLQ